MWSCGSPAVTIPATFTSFSPRSGAYDVFRESVTGEIALPGQIRVLPLLGTDSNA